MRPFKLWTWLLWLIEPPTFYSGGGGSTAPQTNPEEQALAQISQEKWDYYKNKFVPIENQWIAQTKTLNDPMYHSQAESLASNEVKARYGPQTAGLSTVMNGGHKLGVGNYLSEASDIGQASNKASLGTTDRYLKGLGDIVAMGQGQSTQAIQGLGDVAQSSVQGQIGTNENKFRAQQDSLTPWGMAAGGAMAAASNYKPSKGA